MPEPNLEHVFLLQCHFSLRTVQALDIRMDANNAHLITLYNTIKHLSHCNLIYVLIRIYEE